MELKLLIVEDDNKQVKLYQDAINEFNKSSDIQIVPEISHDLNDGLEKLKIRNFDAAVVDLILGSEDTEGKGNEILREILKNLRFPIFVMTGFLDELDEDLRIENAFYKVYRRTDKSTDDLLKDITDLYKTGITRILGGKGVIEELLQRVFWEHIADNMDCWKSEVKDTQKCERILSRCILTYLSEHLSMIETGEFDFYHPAEVYIIPPIKRDFFIGDILKEKNCQKFYIILTPACDMVLRRDRQEKSYRNAEKILLVNMIQLEEVQEIDKYIKNPSNTNEKKVERYIKNIKKNRYHFLPPFGTIRGFLIDFQNVHSVEYSDLLEHYDRIASTDSEFLKDIIARFSSYYSRQGQPTFDKLTVCEKLKQLRQSKL